MQPWEWAHFMLNRVVDLAFAFGVSHDRTARFYALILIPLNFIFYNFLVKSRAATMKLHRGHTAQLGKTALSAMAIVFILLVMLYVRYATTPCVPWKSSAAWLLIRAVPSVCAACSSPQPLRHVETPFWPCVAANS